MSAVAVADTCGWGGCGRPAECGPWCRPCWDDIMERHVEAALSEAPDMEYLARKFVIAEAQRDHLARITYQTTSFCTSQGCGHLLLVHTDGGCAGLSGVGFDDWGTVHAPCRCAEFTPNVWWSVATAARELSDSAEPAGAQDF